MSAADIEDIAARWLIRREEADWSTDNETAFNAWLNESMANRAAFWRLEKGWREADRIPALGTVAAAPVVELQPRRSWIRGTSVAALASMAAMLALVLGTLFWFRATPAEQPTAMAYQTVKGGRGTVRLADGSKVELNTATSIRSAMAPDAREVWLDRGEAFFDIVHRPDRRFVVHAGPRTITVLGTRFSVRREGDRITVAVLSGRVRVEDTKPKELARPSILDKGEVAVTRGEATLVADRSVDTVESMNAWRDGLLVFDNTSLNDAVAEFNRYSRVPIRISDAGLARIRIGGSFQTRNADAFLDLLETAYGLHVERRPTEVELRR